MAQVIVDQTITDSPWHILGKGEVPETASHPLVALETYLQHRDKFARRVDIGVWIDADEQAEALEEFVDDLPIVALNFPAFFDGRSLSNANILRRSLGYRGELRAIGDVRRDQIDQMRRCGINAFQMAEGQDIDAALASLRGSSYAYQTSVDNPEPLFRSHRRRQAP